MSSTEDITSLSIQKNNFDKIFKSKKILIAIAIAVLLSSLIFILI